MPDIGSRLPVGWVINLGSRIPVDRAMDFGSGINSGRVIGTGPESQQLSIAIGAEFHKYASRQRLKLQKQ